MGGRRKDEGGQLLRKCVSIVIIFINSLINKAGKDLDFILQMRKSRLKSFLLPVFKHQQLKNMYFAMILKYWV